MVNFMRTAVNEKRKHEGNPALTPEEEYAIRRKLVERALEALTIEVEDQTIFEV